MDKMLMVVINASTTWMEVSMVNSATTCVTIDRLKQMFATQGLPDS